MKTAGVQVGDDVWVQGKPTGSDPVRGTVRRVLSSGEHHHPRGVKVRLACGTVGRVVEGAGEDGGRAGLQLCGVAAVIAGAAGLGSVLRALGGSA